MDKYTARQLATELPSTSQLRVLLCSRFGEDLAARMIQLPGIDAAVVESLVLVPAAKLTTLEITCGCHVVAAMDSSGILDRVLDAIAATEPMWVPTQKLPDSPRERANKP